MTCSFAFSLVEELVGHNIWNSTEIGSVTLGIFESIAQGDNLVSYYSNGYLVFYTESNSDRRLYMDLITGIVRDALHENILGTPCYCGPITDKCVEYAQSLLNGSKSVQDLEIMGNASINFGGAFGIIVNEIVGGSLTLSGLGSLAAFGFVGAVSFGSLAFMAGVIEVCRPYFVWAYDSIGQPELAEWYRTNDIFDILTDSFTIVDLSNIDTLRGVPKGTTIKEMENIGSKLNYYDIIRSGILINLVKDPFKGKNIEISLKGAKEATKIGKIDGPEGNKTLFFLNFFKAAASNLKLGFKDAGEGIKTNNPPIIAKGIAKIISGAALGEFISFFTLSEIVPKHTWNYIIKIIKNI